MAKLNEFNNTTLALLVNGAVPNELRPYLGMSQLGHPCPRYLWYSFRWCYKQTISRRLRRLFNRGHREEPVIYEELRRIGITIHSTQDEMVAAWGHIKGHCDGVVSGLPEAHKTLHLLEIKTASDSKFKQMQKLRLQNANPVYWAQCQLYMQGLGLTRCLFIMVNKNDDNLYIERIEYDNVIVATLLKKGEKIVLSAVPPERAFHSTYFECKWCNARKICHEAQTVQELNCRTCKHIEVKLDAKWGCALFDIGLNEAAQRRGCSSHELIEELK